jgi:ubiquinone biosynthesis accessory factor UbiJ
MIGPTLKSAATATLELLVNQALQLDPASRTRLAALAGQVFHIECTAPALDLFVLPQSDPFQLQIAGHWEGAVTAGLRGSGKEFVELLTSTDPGATLINGNMTVHGDSQALLRLRSIVADLDIDWEAPLARVFGDVVGNQMGRGLRQFDTLLRQAGNSLLRQVRDYVKEESDWLAPRWQVEEFCVEVDRLVARSNHLEARAAQLRQKILNRPPTSAQR